MPSKMHLPDLCSLPALWLILLLSMVQAQSTRIITTVTIAGPTTPPSAQYTDPPILKEAVLNSTNTFRYQHDAVALVWNDTLAKFADKAADPCKFAHTIGPYGENLAQGYANVTAAIDAWGYERDLYDFDKGDFATEWGHFTQLVWQNTTNVGCGVKDCGKTAGWILFCEYSPRGNILRQFQDNVKKQSNSEVGVFKNSTNATRSGGDGGMSANGAQSGCSGPGTLLMLVSPRSHWFRMSG